MNLVPILKNGENSKCEFKSEEVHSNSLAEEIVAFANFEGGSIFIGINDQGQVVGCQRSDIEEFVVNVCRNNVRPSLIPVIEKLYVDNLLVLQVEILKGDHVYSTNKGLFYIRVGSTKQIPTQQELLRLFQRRNLLQYDETPVINALPQSIDLNKVNLYLNKLEQEVLDEENTSTLFYDLSNVSVLLEVEKQYYPTFAGLLLFGKNPQKHFPSFSIRCGAYRGNDLLSEVISEKEVTGTLEEQIENAIAFLKFVIPQDHAMEDPMKRKDQYLYPMEALREGIVNAVCHRDYTITGSAIRVFVFQNRIEIRSPGGLPNTLTLESMIFRQFTRNQSIASFLSGLGYMERRGKGVQRMKKSCKQRNIQCHFTLTPDLQEFVVVLER